MQDSLEDFIRISRNTKEESGQVKKETIITAQIKKECETKALQIIQFAIDGKMRSDALFKCLPFINQSHYQDIVEERAITKLCGYPICSKKIADMPKKQFFISTKNNKVYDITDRKNYCSNYCYRASVYIKNQIDTSPLWLRKYNEKVQFSLLHKSEKGLPGEVIDQGITKPVLDTRFTSVSSFTQISLDEAEELELNPQEDEPKTQLKKPRKFKKTKMKTINENEEENENEGEPKKLIVKEDIIDESATKLNIDEHKKDNELKINSIESNKPTTDIDMYTHLKKCFNEWLTLDSYIFIYGEDNIREKLDSEQLGNYFESLRISESQIEQQKRYMLICRRLQLQELAEEKFDSILTGNKSTNSIPDYRRLKNEGKNMDLKVKSFYRGDLHVQEDTNFPSKSKNESDETSTEEGAPAVLPLVDVHSHNALRRKIFFNSLNKTIHNLFQTLRLSPSLVLSDLQSLVKTFKLSSHNIVFKAPLWNYIAIMLLKILAMKDNNLKSILENAKVRSQLQLCLSSLPQHDQLITDILSTLSDIDSFVKNYINCK